MDLFRWNEAKLPDTFRTKFHPSMLDEDGYAVKRTVGDRRNSVTHRAYVIFDRDYVLTNLKRQFKLLGITKHDAIELVNDIKFDDEHREYEELRNND